MTGADVTMFVPDGDPAACRSDNHRIAAVIGRPPQVMDQVTAKQTESLKRASGTSDTPRMELHVRFHPRSVRGVAR